MALFHRVVVLSLKYYDKGGEEHASK